MGRGEGGEEQAQRMRDLFIALAVCHTVIPEKFEDSDEVRVVLDFRCARDGDGGDGGVFDIGICRLFLSLFRLISLLQSKAIPRYSVTSPAFRL